MKEIPVNILKYKPETPGWEAEFGICLKNKRSQERFRCSLEIIRSAEVDNSIFDIGKVIII